MRLIQRLAMALSMLMLCAAGSAAGARTFDREVPAQPRGAVEISNVNGEVKVSGWDRAAVSVHAELESDTEQVDISTEGGHTLIKVREPHGMGAAGEARLEVRVPKDSELSVSAVDATVTTAGVLGVQHLNTVSGDISAEVGAADADLKTVNGNISLRGKGQPARLHVSTVSGDLHLEHAGGDIEASTVNGTLGGSLDAARSLRARTTAGEVRFEGSLAHGATVDATSVSGNIALRAAADGGYAYEVSSFSGEISDCFGANPERASQYGPGSRLGGTRGEGMGHVRLKTMSGNVQLCDHR
jgi:hypothetical protein